MFRPCSALLCVVVIFIMMTAGCASFQNTSPSPLITGQGTTPAISGTSTESPAATSQPGTAGTQASVTCSADISSDVANCGGCGNACPANALCQAGQCYCNMGYTVENNHCVVAPAGTFSGNGCPEGMSPCPDGNCYELNSSAANCGQCGNVCPASMICSASTCTNAATEATTAPTTSVTTTAVTTGTTTSITTSSVGTGLTLVKPGGLTVSCVILGLTNCGSTCVNLTTSGDNCGACGTKCPAGPLLGCCKGTCMSFASDPSNCGSCGHTCSIYSTCSAGSCTVKVATRVTLAKIPLTYAIVNPIDQNPINPGN